MSINPQQQLKFSQASNPDLDWSQVRETVSMLCLAVVQIEASLKDGANSVAQLTTLFTNIAGHASAISAASGNMKKVKTEDENDDSTTMQSVQMELEQHVQHLSQLAEGISGNIHEAVCTFQFYDRVNQRLDHVVEGLNKLGELIGNPSNIYNPNAWSNFQQEIKSSYSMECERLMFEQVMRGASVEEALEIYNHNFESNANSIGDSSDEIELF